MADHITKIGAARMLRGAELLTGVPRRLFNMSSWYIGAIKHVGDHRNPKIHDSPRVKCRSAACALGWMANDPWFRRKGLRLTVDLEDFQFAKDTNEPIVNGDVKYKNTSGMCAAMQFFDISLNAAIALFGERHYGRTPKQVATHLRRFVETGTTP